jgi:nucleoside-diphosphate-sugar epimerase
MILVTSAYGNNGRKLIPKLAEMGLDVRALNLSDKTDKLKDNWKCSRSKYFRSSYG